MEPSGESFTQVVLDDDGDLLIKVIDSASWPLQNKEFLVDSHTMARASEKWKELVKAMQKHSSSSKHPITNLRGNSTAYDLIFFVMHCRFADIPTKLDQPTFYELLKITEEYQVTYLLQPWVVKWVKDHQEPPCVVPPQYDRVYFIPDLHERLWIAWVLGAKLMFRDIIMFIIRKMSIDECSTVLIDGADLSKNCEIPGLLDYLKKQYHDKTQALRGVFENAMENKDYRFYGANESHERKVVYHCECGQHDLDGQFCRLCTIPSHHRDRCNIMILGSITYGYRQKMATIGNQTKQTISELYESLVDIEILNNPDERKTIFSKTHDFCNPASYIARQLDKVISSIAEVLGADLEQHLDRQAKFTGLPVYMLKRTIKPTWEEFIEDERYGYDELH
ncbi:hypothetical protein PG993_008473 [Apiospora rasikravindrae]|uniref:BTB domain-containing protein n=1 Tax=Apiospora rasikravindrae TaxID=990691 RepID=A0ABR1T0F2_9PEZI